MEKFKISDIQEIFTSDVERFHSLTQQYVSQLLDEPTVAQEALDEALRQCHTLKGLAATVQAWGLACLGGDYEKLLEVASSWVQHEREKANEVFQFMLDHMQDWYVMNQFTCMDMLPQAWDVYQGLRVVMEERWPGYLPAVGTGAGVEAVDAQYVRLADLEISEVGTEGSAADGEVAAVKEDLDVQGTLPVAASVAQSGAPLPVRVVPPVLKHRDEGKFAADVQAQEATAESSEVASLEARKLEAKSSDQPATPKPLQVVPPTLLRRDGVSHEAKTQEAGAAVPAAENVPLAPEMVTAKSELLMTGSATPANEVPPTVAKAEAAPGTQTPPILRVAPPTLKRRGKKAESTVVAREAAEVPVAPETPTEQLPPKAAEFIAPVEPVAALSAEAIFAALPETVEETAAVAQVQQTAQVVEVAPAGEFKPGKDAELLEMLSQEVAGYLTELMASLSALAGDLSATEPWEKTRRLFHTIKGTAGTFGLDTVSAPAKAAEARCLVAIEDVSARNREAFDSCVQRAAGVAKSLHLQFDEGRLREALETALAQAANTAAANATVMTSSLDPDMAGFFVNDTRDQIAVIEQAVLLWEKGGATQSAESRLEQVWAAQRGFHTIKGAGNSIGLTAVAHSVHEVEAFLEGLAGQGATGSKAIFTFLLGAVDQLRQYLVALAKNPTAPWRHDWSTTLVSLGQPAQAVVEKPLVMKAAAVAEVDGEDGATVGDSNWLRIETSRLHQLMNLISEMVIDRARLARKIDQLAGLHRALAERNGALTGSVLNFQQEFEFNLMQQAAAEARAESDRGQVSGERNPAVKSAEARHASEFSELEFDRYDQFNVLARSLVEISHDIEQLNGDVAVCLDSFAAENVHFAHTSQELQSKVTSLSLVPVNTLFPRLQRSFRDALNVEHKEADLVLVGGEAMLDKVVVDKVYAPLLHLLRNAVSHGIEDVATRSRLKKPTRGTVRVSAAQLSNQIVLQIADDGGGVDAAAVRERAVAKGWVAADAPALSPEQVVAFIFKPGFSTATKVTSVSGRGIGLDVVRKEVENLNGSVELKYEAGQGSTWTLRLPLTLSISEAILAEVGGTQFAFPLNFIEAGLILEPEQLKRDAESGAESYPVERRLVELETESAELEGAEDGPKFDWLPVMRLSRVLGIAGNESSNKGLIVSVGDRRTIVVVDVVMRRQEIVVKQLDSVMALHPLLNGASLDAEGRVIPILNLPTLLKLGERGEKSGARGENLESASNSSIPASDSSRRQTRVLVVDDSLSVRKVQERYLRDLGCVVTVARDGLEGLEKLREGNFDLILTDLEMPRVNGYELISEVRGNPAWSGVPVVVISSRGADKYITKAMNLGASTFLSKPFTQAQLKQVLGHYVRS